MKKANRFPTVIDDNEWPELRITDSVVWVIIEPRQSPPKGVMERKTAIPSRSGVSAAIMVA